MTDYSFISPSENQIRAVKKALERTQRLLDQNGRQVDYDEIHSVKSILYAAIGQIGIRADRLFSAQRMLRELLAIVTTKADLQEHEKDVGKQIINEINERYQIDLMGNNPTQMCITNEDRNYRTSKFGG